MIAGICAVEAKRQPGIAFDRSSGARQRR